MYIINIGREKYLPLLFTPFIDLKKILTTKNENSEKFMKGTLRPQIMKRSKRNGFSAAEKGITLHMTYEVNCPIPMNDQT